MKKIQRALQPDHPTTPTLWYTASHIWRG